MKDNLDFSTLCLHSDSVHQTSDIAPPLSVTTTYEYPVNFNSEAAVKMGILPQTDRVSSEEPNQESFHIYCRSTTETRNRLELVLGSLEQSSFAVTYASGLAAISALFTHVNPKKVVMSKEGYHGTHSALDVYKRGRSLEVEWLEDMSAEKLGLLNETSLLFLESPLNPRGEVCDMGYYRKTVGSGCVIAIDATLCPPPLQMFLSHGADIVMHSSTKFLGGHSDLLGGVLTTLSKHRHKSLLDDRCYLGSTMGNMEAWLLLRSLRTLKVRVMEQSRTAVEIVAWLTSKSEDCLSIVDKVWHASLVDHPGHLASLKQGSGFSGVLSIEFKSPHHARLLCTNTTIFTNATSIGGCESKVEWRAAVDSKIVKTLVRVSIGLESARDLIDDLRQTFIKVAILEQKINL